jgi:TPR repeat protein
VKQNSELAIKLFKRAAEKGYGKSMQNLGWVYSCGIGVENRAVLFYYLIYFI